LNKPYIIGFTDQDTVKLDLDGIPIDGSEMIADYLLTRFGLEGYIILNSSGDNHLVLFNRPVTWEDNTHIMGFASWMIKTEDFNRWLVMQLIKKSSTVRVSAKGDKPAPVQVLEKGTVDNCIQRYRQFVKLVKLTVI